MSEPDFEPTGLEILAMVFRADNADGSKMLGVKADNPGHLGVAAFTICQAVAGMPVFSPQVRAAALALQEAISSHKMPTVVIGPDGAGGAQG